MPFLSRAWETTPGNGYVSLIHTMGAEYGSAADYCRAISRCSCASRCCSYLNHLSPLPLCLYTPPPSFFSVRAIIALMHMANKRLAEKSQSLHPRREGGHDPCICCTAQLCLLPRTPHASRSAPEDARTQGPGWEAQRPPRAATEDGIRLGSEGSPCWAAGCVFRDLGACSLAAALPQAAGRLRSVQTTGFIGGFYRYRLHRGRTAPEGGGREAARGGPCERLCGEA